MFVCVRKGKTWTKRQLNLYYNTMRFVEPQTTTHTNTRTCDDQRHVAAILKRGASVSHYRTPSCYTSWGRSSIETKNSSYQTRFSRFPHAFVCTSRHPVRTHVIHTEFLGFSRRNLDHGRHGPSRELGLACYSRNNSALADLPYIHIHVCVCVCV